MEAIISGLCKTIESVAHLASPENIENPVQINSRQCDLLAKKASGVLHVLEELRRVICREEFIKDGPKLMTHALEGLHRVLKDAEGLVRDCCCGGQWLEVAISRGNLKETFAKLLYDIEWHTSVLLATRSDRSDVFDRSACEGKLGVVEDFMLSQAAKQDQVVLQQRLEGTHVSELETRAVDEKSSIAAKLLEKLVAEEEMNRSAISSESQSPLFLWAPWGDLKTGKRIGKGGFAEVMEVTWLGQTYALKLFLGGTGWSGLFKKEIAAMVGLDHPHLVRVVCCLEDEYNLGIVMELMYKSLYDLLQDRRRHPRASGATTRFPILLSVDLMLQIGEGVKYLHSKNLAHRDLKSANVLVQFADPQVSPDSFDHLPDNPFVAKIADFGMSAVKNASTARNTYGGTSNWIPPELFGYEDIELLEPSPRFRPFKMDAYSFGMVCYEILTGEMPFYNVKGTTAEFRKLVKSGARPDLPDEITRTRLGTIVQRCWDKDSRKRPDFSTICTELRYIKGLLLQGKSVAADLKPEIKEQGPWGGNGGGQFSDEVVTSIKQTTLGVVMSIKQITLMYNTNPGPCIWYFETTYDVDGKLFTVGHGTKHQNSAEFKIEIDEPNEYLTQIEGSYGDVPVTVGGKIVSGLTSLTIRTTERTHGPFGIESGTKFKSEAGRIVGFYGRCGLAVDQIGCFTAPADG